MVITARTMCEYLSYCVSKVRAILAISESECKSLKNTRFLCSAKYFCCVSLATLLNDSLNICFKYNLPCMHIDIFIHFRRLSSCDYGKNNYFLGEIITTLWTIMFKWFVLFQSTILLYSMKYDLFNSTAIICWFVVLYIIKTKIIARTHYVLNYLLLKLWWLSQRYLNIMIIFYEKYFLYCNPIFRPFSYTKIQPIIH